MNRPLYLLAAVLLGSQFVGAQGAQPAHDYSLTVDLDVTADNPALKSEIQSDFLQEIRALDRSVTITTVHPTYRLRVAAISIGDRAAPTGDFAVSYIYSVLEKVPNSVIGAYRELLLGDLAMLSGAKGGRAHRLPEDCRCLRCRNVDRRARNARGHQKSAGGEEMRLILAAVSLLIKESTTPGGAEQILSLLDHALTKGGHQSLVVAAEGSRAYGQLFPTIGS